MAAWAPAAIRTAPAASVLPSASLHARDALALRGHAGHARTRAHEAARAAHGLGKRCDEAARIHGVVARDVERQADRRRQRRLGAARGGREQPLDVEPEPLPEGEQPVERLRLVAIARDDERSRPAQAGVAARSVGELGAELREPGGGAQAEPEQRVLAELRLRDRREHPGRDMPGARIACVEHAHAQSALGGAPRAREADRPAADYGDVRLGMLHRHLQLTPSLRRYYPDQVRRSAPRWRPLSPFAGSRMRKG